MLDVSVWSFGSCHNDESDIEFVSPPIRSEADLATLRSVMKALRDMGGVRVTPGAGLHVHIGAGHLSLPQLRAVTQQLYKYEPALDILVPASRRIAGGSNQFIYSNRSNKHWSKMKATNAQLNAALATASKMKLVQWTNPNYSARYVVSLRRMVRNDCKQAIKPAAQTIEFRQQVATLDDVELLSWMQLLGTILKQAATLPAPKSAPDDMKPSVLLQDMLENLLQDKQFLEKNSGAIMAMAKADLG